MAIEVTYYEHGQLTALSASPDGTFFRVPVYHLDFNSELSQKELTALNDGYRKVYVDICYAREYYTKGIGDFIAAKVINFLNEKVLWGFLKTMYHLGFIYVPRGEMFSWKQHFFVVCRG